MKRVTTEYIYDDPPPWYEARATSHMACPKCGSHRVGCYRSAIRRKHRHRCAVCGHREEFTR